MAAASTVGKLSDSNACSRQFQTAETVVPIYGLLILALKTREGLKSDVVTLIREIGVHLNKYTPRRLTELAC